MPSLLHVESSPLRDGSVSRTLAASFLDSLRARCPGLSVVRRDLTRDPPPPIDAAWADAMFLPPQAHTEVMRAALAPSEIYIRELVEADRYLFSMPMHNFTVPANLKCYIDHCLRPGRVFRVLPNGTEGMLEGKQALVITARGGYYRTADPKSDFQEPYMRKVFRFIGVTDVAFVHAEGLDLGPEARAAGLQQAMADIEEQVEIWARGSAA
jgi:FMN-dependent NADH-azoreductase